MRGFFCGNNQRSTQFLAAQMKLGKNAICLAVRGQARQWPISLQKHRLADHLHLLAT